MPSAAGIPAVRFSCDRVPLPAGSNHDLLTRVSLQGDTTLAREES